MKYLLFTLMILAGLSCRAQLAQQPESEISEDYTGMYLRSAGSQMIIGPCLTIAGAAVASAVYYSGSADEFAAFGIGLSIVGIGITLSGGFNLIKAGKQYELNHKK